MQQNTPTVGNRQPSAAELAALYFKTRRLPIDAPDAVRAEYRRLERRSWGDCEEEV